MHPFHLRTPVSATARRWPALVVLAATASYSPIAVAGMSWFHPTKSEDAYKTDIYTCMRESAYVATSAFASDSYAWVDSEVSSDQTLTRACMEARGWRVVGDAEWQTLMRRREASWYIEGSRAITAENLDRVREILLYDSVGDVRSLLHPPKPKGAVPGDDRYTAWEFAVHAINTHDTNVAICRAGGDKKELKRLSKFLDAETVQTAPGKACRLAWAVVISPKAYGSDLLDDSPDLRAALPIDDARALQLALRGCLWEDALSCQMTASLLWDDDRSRAKALLKVAEQTPGYSGPTKAIAERASVPPHREPASLIYAADYLRTFGKPLGVPIDASGLSTLGLLGESLGDETRIRPGKVTEDSPGVCSALWLIPVCQEGELVLELRGACSDDQREWTIDNVGASFESKKGAACIAESAVRLGAGKHDALTGILRDVDADPRLSVLCGDRFGGTMTVAPTEDGWFCAIEDGSKGSLMIWNRHGPDGRVTSVRAGRVR